MMKMKLVLEGHVIIYSQNEKGEKVTIAEFPICHNSPLLEIEVSEKPKEESRDYEEA